VWHTQSTVSGEFTQAGSRQTEVQPAYVSSLSRVVEDDEKIKDKIKQETKDAGVEDQIAAYYAAVRANAQEDAAHFAAEDADFSEDDGHWEDGNIGGISGSSAVSTPIQPPSTETQTPTQPASKPDDYDDDDEDEEFEDV